MCSGVTKSSRRWSQLIKPNPKHICTWLRLDEASKSTDQRFTFHNIIIITHELRDEVNTYYILHLFGGIQCHRYDQLSWTCEFLSIYILWRNKQLVLTAPLIYETLTFRGAGVTLALSRIWSLPQ